MSLRDLTAYLKENLPQLEEDLFESDQVDSSDIEYTLTLADDFNNVWLLSREYYQGVLYFESWTHSKELLISHIATWCLNSGRREEELGLPTIEPLENDDNSYDIIVSVNFMDCIYVSPHPEGDLMLNDEPMKRVLLNPEVAEGFEFADS